MFQSPLPETWPNYATDPFVGRRPVITITIRYSSPDTDGALEQQATAAKDSRHQSVRPPTVATASCLPQPHNHCQLVCVALDSRRRQTTKWFPMPPENKAPRRDTECRPAMHCQFGFGGVGSMGDNIRKKATSDTLPKPGKVNSGTILFLLLHFYLLMFTYR